MPKAVFMDIYHDLRENIEDGTYGYQSFLPSEAELTQLFNCSRSSIRRALGMLAQDGYVQAQQGKGRARHTQSHHHQPRGLQRPRDLQRARAGAAAL